MIHKIREAMLQRDNGYLLADIVEVDDAFWGASGGKQGRGTKKAKVIVDVSLTEDSKPQFAKMTVVDDIKTTTINSIVKRNVKDWVVVVINAKIHDATWIDEIEA